MGFISLYRVHEGQKLFEASGLKSGDKGSKIGFYYSAVSKWGSYWRAELCRKKPDLWRKPYNPLRNDPKTYICPIYIWETYIYIYRYMSIPINQLDICPYIYPKHLMKPYTRNDPKSQNRLYLISSIYIYIYTSKLPNTYKAEITKNPGPDQVWNLPGALRINPRKPYTYIYSFIYIYINHIDIPRIPNTYKSPIYI